MTPIFRAEKAESSHTDRTGGITVALAFALSIQIAPSFAADFSHAQKVYVPSSSYDRRIDFSSIREQYSKSTASSGKSAATSTAKPASKSASTGAHKATPAHKSATAPVHKTAGAKTATVLKAETPMMDTSLAGKSGPAPALDGKMANGKSLGELARSLGQKIPPGAIAKMKAQAVEFEKSGKLDEAQRLLTKVAQMTPEDKANLQAIATISVQRARNYLKTNNLPEALLAARQALAASPAYTEAHSVLGQLYTKVGVNPNDIRSRLQTANNLYSQGRYQEAEVEYKASLAVKPTAEAHIGLGKVAQKLQGDTAGKAHFEHALEVDSNSSHAHRELGVHHLKSNDLATANSELSRALILDPKDKEASQHLIKLWQGQVSRLPNGNSHFGLARAYQLSGDLAAAQAEYREVVRVEPNHPQLPAARQSFKIALAKQEAEKAMSAAKSLESQGLYAEAIARMNDAIGFAPGNSAYKIYQGELLEKLGDRAQAKQVYLSVLKDDPQNLTAVQKIKGLGNIAAAAAGVAAGLLPGGANGVINRHPAGFPGTKFPMDMTADASTLSSAVQPMDHVGQLGGFMTQVRNQMLIEAEKGKKVDSAVGKAKDALVKYLVPPDEPEEKAAGAAGGESDDDIVKKILASPSPSAGAGASAGAAAAETGAAAALANAKAALDAIKGAGADKPASAGAKKAPSATKTANASSQKLQDLEQQNKLLQDQLNQLKAQSTASAAMPPVAPPVLAPPVSAAPPSIPSEFVPSQPVSGYPDFSGFGALGSPTTAPPVAPAGMPSEMQMGVPQSVPMGVATPLPMSMVPQGVLNAAMGQAGIGQGDQPQLRGPIGSNQPIRFELKNIRPGLKDVSLKVALRNDGNEPLLIPANLQAVVKYPNQTESEMKIAFDSKTVAPHGAVDGVVKVPFSKVDPTADLVLRNLLPANEELHIIKTAVSLSQ